MNAYATYRHKEKPCSDTEVKKATHVDVIH